MAISQAMCTSFKVGLLDGVFNFGTGTTDVYKIALYTSAATLDATTTAYTSSDEVSSSGTNYTAGGNTLTVSQIPTDGGSGTTAYLSFANTTWVNATITARGALIYKADGVTNPAVAVLDFGSDKSSTDGDFAVIFPSATNTTAIIRIA